MKTGKKRAIARLKANIKNSEAMMRAKVSVADRTLGEALVSAQQGCAILQLAGIDSRMENAIIERILNMQRLVQLARDQLK